MARLDKNLLNILCWKSANKLNGGKSSDVMRWKKTEDSGMREKIRSFPRPYMTFNCSANLGNAIPI